MLLKAEEHFNIIVDSQQPFPLNLSFELSQDLHSDFQGPGIFFLYYKTELIYIGFFYPSQKNRDVRKERMNKELATITMRGKQITMNPTSNKAFDLSVHLKNIPRRPKGDFLTSRNRVRFADKNWSEFQNDNFLKDFEFYWFKEVKKLGRTRIELKAVTNQLINFYKPTCNGK
jgi:hypothetical protein